MLVLSKKVNRLEIYLTVIGLGKDLCILLTGGDTPHLGALTFGTQNEIENTFSFGTHKEGVITEIFSNRLKKCFSGKFVICCGIHLDNITKLEIGVVKQLCTELAEESCNLLFYNNLCLEV